MATNWMSELATSETADVDVVLRNQLPRRKASRRDVASRTGRVSVRRRRVLRVLVVHDDRVATDRLATLVRSWGHVARTVNDSAAALRSAATMHPDVVLLDIEMPMTGGIQAARRLRLDLAGQDCLIFAITRRADHERRRLCREAGIDVVLTKPIDPAVMETLLLLECTRVNLSSRDNTAVLATDGTPDTMFHENTVGGTVPST